VGACRITSYSKNLFYGDFKYAFRQCNGAGKNPGPSISWASKFCSWANENRSSEAQWASEISLSSLVSVNENVSLMNDNLQSEAI